MIMKIMAPAGPVTPPMEGQGVPLCQYLLVVQSTLLKNQPVCFYHLPKLTSKKRSGFDLWTLPVRVSGKRKVRSK
jgi:hypothetical protein